MPSTLLGVDLRAQAAGDPPTLPEVAAPAQVADNPCGVQNFFFAGAESDFDTSNYGVRSNIEYREPALCETGNSPSNSSWWTMLVPRTPGAQYAQVGFKKQGAEVTLSPFPNGKRVFAQVTRRCAPNCPGGQWNVISGWTAAGADPGTTMFSVHLRASDDRIHMLADSTNILTMDRDVTGEWSTDWGGIFAGETWHRASDVSGTAANKTNFNSIQVYNSAGQLDYIPGAQLSEFKTPNNTRYHKNLANASSGGGKRLVIWTDPL